MEGLWVFFLPGFVTFAEGKNINISRPFPRIFVSCALWGMGPRSSVGFLSSWRPGPCCPGWHLGVAIFIWFANSRSPSLSGNCAFSLLTLLSEIGNCVTVPLWHRELPVQTSRVSVVAALRCARAPTLQQLSQPAFLLFVKIPLIWGLSRSVSAPFCCLRFPFSFLLFSRSGLRYPSDELHARGGPVGAAPGGVRSCRTVVVACAARLLPARRSHEQCLAF